MFNSFSNNKKYLNLAVISFLIYAVIIFLVFYNNFVNIIDDSINSYFVEFAPNHFPKIAIIITNFADLITIMYAMSALLIILVIRKFYIEALLMLSLTLGDYFITSFFKNIFDRQRPEFHNLLTHTSGYSFPSGHTTFAVCFYGGLIFLIQKYVKNNKIKRIMSLFLLFLIILIGFSRIYLGAHYFTDVMGGLSLGLSWLFLNIFAYKLLLSNPK